MFHLAGIPKNTLTKVYLHLLGLGTGHFAVNFSKVHFSSWAGKESNFSHLVFSWQNWRSYFQQVFTKA